MLLNGEFLSAEESGNPRKFMKLLARHQRLEELLRTDLNGDHIALDNIFSQNRRKLRSLGGIEMSEADYALIEEHYILRASELHPDLAPHQQEYTDKIEPEEPTVISRVLEENNEALRMLACIDDPEINEALHIERVDELWEVPVPDRDIDTPVMVEMEFRSTEEPEPMHPDYSGDFSIKEHPYNYMMDVLGLDQKGNQIPRLERT